MSNIILFKLNIALYTNNEKYDILPIQVIDNFT